MKTKAFREKRKRHHKRWLKKHPEVVLKSIRKWIKRVKDPKEKKRAKEILKRHLEEFKKSATLDSQTGK